MCSWSGARPWWPRRGGARWCAAWPNPHPYPYPYPYPYTPTPNQVEYELALQRSGMPQPWGLVEKLADELLEELLHSGA